MVNSATEWEKMGQVERLQCTEAVRRLFFLEMGRCFCSPLLMLGFDLWVMECHGQNGPIQMKILKLFAVGKGTAASLLELH